MEKTMEKIVALAKARGFVYPGSEIYGGLANTWDYGNLGVELKNNVKKAWWQKFIQESPYNVGVDCAILMNPQTWVASGHLGGFSDPLMDCKECHERFRADKLIEDFCEENGIAIEGSVDGWSQEEMKNFIEEHNVPCPTCGKHNFTDIRQFNLMFKTFQGVTEDAKNTVYLRPETAQGIFVNFKNVQRTSRKKIPFGIGQIGKSFRNEITPGNFTFRTREFEQMKGVQVEDALKHPNWTMGRKITIDSSTMVNKGLEVMEARWLFGVEMDQVQVVVQPQSVIHSMVEYEDGAVIAQLGTPDMKLPIQYALYYPERRFLAGDRLDFAKLAQITFEAPDFENFHGLSLAYKAGRRGGTLPTVFNAANERAVQKFLDREIGYLTITDMIEAAMEHHTVKENPTVEEILAAEQETYDFIESRW